MSKHKDTLRQLNAMADEYMAESDRPNMSAKHSETHSALPWSTSPDYETVIYGVGGINTGKAIALVYENWDGSTEADAAYIVRCVNSHEQLVSALELAREALYLHTGPDEPGDMPDPLQEQISDALEIARGGGE